MRGFGQNGVRLLAIALLRYRRLCGRRAKPVDRGRRLLSAGGSGHTRGECHETSDLCDFFRSDYLHGRIRNVKCRTHSSNSNGHGC